jgi:hypothetical protein
MIEFSSVPIVALADDPLGPAILIVPGPTYISFHRCPVEPKLYSSVVEGNNDPPILILLVESVDKISE